MVYILAFSPFVSRFSDTTNHKLNCKVTKWREGGEKTNDAKMGGRQYVSESGLFFDTQNYAIDPQNVKCVFIMPVMRGPLKEPD